MVLSSVIRSAPGRGVGPAAAGAFSVGTTGPARPWSAWILLAVPALTVALAACGGDSSGGGAGEDPFDTALEDTGAGDAGGDGTGPGGDAAPPSGDGAAPPAARDGGADAAGGPPGSAAGPDELSLRLVWSPPARNVDGTRLDDLAGFKVYYGPDSRGYTRVIDVGFRTSFRLSWPAGRWSRIYFAVTAYDDDANESAFSDEVWIDI